ncbi:PAS domain-containing sensor histidine kinase [Paracnuella aquatica]|uniref:PAS domain-containing sensor histidine kinase n=1 Tax=Paracnuella aquatica TaxID=2268757 RepID=UPI000DEF1EA0|nr:PAS domain S-box protein [Paracnuella aquatica]RPD44445.1 PAS domain S-box protein [Paracnuella aquatica]
MLTINKPELGAELPLFQQSPLPGWIVGADGAELLASNDAAAAFVPHTLPRFDEPPVLAHFCHPKDQQRLTDALAQPGENNSLGVFLMRLQNGQQQSTVLYASPFKVAGTNGWQVTAVPAAERITHCAVPQPEEGCCNQNFFRSLIFEASYGSVLCDAEGVVQFVTPAVETILHFKPHTIIGHNIFAFVHPHDHEVAHGAFDLELKGMPELRSILIRLKNGAGGYTWCTVRGHNLLQHPGVQRFVIYFHDDSQRKFATDALKASEERFRTLVRDLQVGVLLLNATGSIMVANAAMGRILGQPYESLTNKCAWDVVPRVIDEEGNELPKERRPVHQSMVLKAPIHHQVNGYWIEEQDAYRWLHINTDPVLDDEGNLQCLLCSFTDITEQKKLNQKLLDEKMAQQRRVARATLHGQERERREIGKELHDNIGQQLTTIKLYLEMASTAPDMAAAQDMVAHALHYVSGSINEVRQISRMLVPHSLQDLGLTESVAELCSTIQRTGNLSVSFRHEGYAKNDLDEQKKLAVYRIIQEQLTNTIRHAAANAVHVSLTRRHDEVHLEIVDDGVGFDPKTVRRGLGLSNIRNRAELFGGSIQLTSAPGQGCRLKVRVPV